MKAKHRTKRIQRYRKMLGIIVLMLTITLIGVVVSATVLYKRKNACKTPDTILVEYMMHIPKQEYEEMYAMIDLESSGYISKEDFLKRNSTIYEGIEMQNMSIKNVEYVEEDKKVTYLTSFDTVAGTISFENEAFFINGEEGYKLVWDDSMIFPNLTSADKVRVSTTQAERGEILDRNGRVLAGKGTASSVGIVPGKLENREEAIAQIAGLLEITTEAIEKNLSAKWVKDDSFVPIKTIPRVEEIELMSISPEEEVLKEKERHNRFRQVWCPGSTFKPIIAAIGLQSGAIDPMEDYGNVGLSWQKDASWGSYHVTTLHAYEPVILENALIYSDNIYFAKAALKIGSDELENSLIRLGFNEELPFEIKMAESQYSNTEGIETEIQLADSGYGQGQILVNPLHMACIYSAFCNEGNVIKPYLVYQNEAEVEYWIPGAFSNETASRVLEGTKKVVNDSNGTGYAAHRDDILLAGKTGTAEIKASKDDTSGTELGWFAIFTAEDTECPILIISMVEDVKGRGGSGYVVKKDSLVLEEWFSSH